MRDLLTLELNKLGRIIGVANASESLDFNTILSGIESPHEMVDILETYYKDVQKIDKQYRKVVDIFEKTLSKSEEEE